MTITTRRKYSRQSDLVPILFTGYDAKRYREATMYNSCPDGMYFESDTPLQPKFDLYIKIQRRWQRCVEPENHRSFRARVKWCRQVTAGDRPRFGVGVQFTAKSHLSYGINIDNAGCLCDFCEERVTSQAAHQTETGLLLCLACFRYMETLPRSIVESMERFLLGNVV
jgi:hypothetical protein